MKISERETVLTVADDELAWTVFTDSARLSRKLLVVARKWGITPDRRGEGHEFILPLGAVRFVGPPSEQQRRASRQSIQKARNALRRAVKQRAPEASLAPDEECVVPAPGGRSEA